MLQLTATTAYFVGTHRNQAETAGTYNLVAEGRAAAAPQAHATTPNRPGSDYLGNEWKIVEEGWRVALRLPAPPDSWRARAPEVVTAAVGDQRQFWVCTGDPCRWADGNQAQVTATLQAIGTRSLIYVDNRDLSAIPISRAGTFRDVFDGQIWPRVTPVFGKPVNPYNATGDGQTIVLFSRSVQELGPAGYFRPLDLFPNSEVQTYGHRSNEASMFYMATHMSDSITHSVNAHEFQHLINFSQKWFVYRTTQLESTWINEGLSMVAMDVAGYGYQVNNVQPYALYFFSEPDRVSLYHWGHADASIYSYYGGAWLVFRYLADRFGNAALTNLIQNAGVGVANLERVTGEAVGRTLVYNGVAMVVSTKGLSVTDPRWRYQSLSLATIGQITYGLTGAKNIRSTGFNFVALSSGGQPVIRTTVTAGTATPYVGLVK